MTQTTRPVSGGWAVRRFGGWPVDGVGEIACAVESRRAVLSAQPPNRPTAGFFGGQMSDGAIATMIISAIASRILRSVLT